MKAGLGVLVLLLTLGVGGLHAQPVDFKHFNYRKADSIAQALSGKDKVWANTAQLADTLTAGLDTDHEKFRVLFKWVCNNITYSFSAMGYDAKRTLKTRKGVCAGYSDLLDDLCYHAGLESKVISGYAKALPEDLDEEFTDTNHAWNSIKLDGKWYLVDATWAAGAYDYRRKKFVKGFNEYYFLTDSINFLKQHFPEPKSMYFQRVDDYITLADFNLKPFYYFTFFEMGMSNEYPKTKNLSYTCTDDFCFSFTSKRPIKEVDMMLTEKLTMQKDAPYYTVEKQGDNYYVTCRFEYEGTYFLTIFIDGYGAMVYNLKVSDI